MMNHCANPQCAKPLHYLREGRIFVFDVPIRNLGGSTEGIRLIPRPSGGFRSEVAAS
jgi:hypothetical protein